MEAFPDRQHDLVVIGASAGGIEALRRVVSGLPADLHASVCIVLHLAPRTPSALAKILERCGPLPCRTAADGEPLRRSEILVAPPDRHLVIDGDHVKLTVGPRENGHRPAVDVLFRSAAAARGRRVIGVVLSGTRDDGSAGLAVIKARGGSAIVQDPEEAMYAGMPQSALASANVDAVVPSGLVADTIVAMVNGKHPVHGGSSDFPDPAAQSAAGAPPDNGNGLTTICPECGGVLSEREEAGVTQWECRVGHRYSPDTLLDTQAQDVEAALWAAVRALEDRRMLLDRMADRFENRGQWRSANGMRSRARNAAQQADLVRDAVSRAASEALREFDQSRPAGAEQTGENDSGGELGA